MPPAGWAESPFDSSKAQSFCPGTNEKLTVRLELTEKRRGVRLAGMVSESESTETKKPPVGGFTTLLIALIILYFPMVPERDLNPHSANAEDFKSLVSTDSTIRARDIKWRRVPESNRTRRICNPLHNRFANAPLILKHPQLPMLLIWSGKRDSNSRPRPWQGRALPTELFPHHQVIC